MQATAGGFGGGITRDGHTPAAAERKRYANMRRFTDLSRHVLLTTVFTVVACAHARQLHPPVTPATLMADHTQMAFKVASAQSGQMLPGVKVSMIGQDATEYDLGQTNMLGYLSVPKAILREHQARVVLFSREHFFTGAIKVDDPGGDFFDYDEKFIELAPFALI